MKTYTGTFEAAGVFFAEAETYDEAISKAADALVALKELEPGVRIEFHAGSWSRKKE